MILALSCILKKAFSGDLSGGGVFKPVYS